MLESALAPSTKASEAKGRLSALWVDDISVSFDGFRALNELTLLLEHGELRCIIGPNGAGKTTMMDVITGKTKPDTGRVFMHGSTIELTALSEVEISRLGVCRKFQRPTVFESLTVFENLELACKGEKGVFASLFRNLSGEQRDRVTETLDSVGLMDRAHSESALLSHGQKQWLEIGMLLVQQPHVLLVDEPVAGMTHAEVERTAELLLSLAGERTVVVVDHDMEFVRSIASTVTVLHEGRVLSEGTMAEVQEDPQVITVYLESEVLEVRRLQQYYGESHTLWDLDLSITEGQCVCVVGRNGVGKTTLLKTIMGLLSPRDGQIMFMGKPLPKGSPDLRARVGIGYVPQGRQVFGQLTVEENLRMGLGGSKKKEPMERAFQWFPVLKEMLQRRGGDLSGGQQQQLAIARALMLNPKLLILDEPTEGIQPNIVQQIADVLGKLAREEKLTVLLVEQKLTFVRRFASHFYAMERGRTVANGTIGALDDKIIQQYLTV